MPCPRFRDAISARADGEDLPPGISGRQLDAHLAGCEACREWQRRVGELRDLTDRLRKAEGEVRGGGTPTPLPQWEDGGARDAAR
ncbi:zf-HC2 domain-containing protein [Streptomyces sp. DSM 44917]|uniref:Zf-HC2 domain-containing protein n=1 Tax=Streptomyces boetiae TaxID=3075541 RepID=A0ABU2LCW2_9ACTN|nr:zf-HC2 domain-containing protein [Streptomyces sp. DSM 44917]MDT0309008.1 zf-HC2 domain-containing protein [Streptomyces sp. DSM 44917]